MIDRSVLHNSHLLHVVEDESIVPLAHKEMLHPPILFLDVVCLVAFYHRQRKLDAPHLQLSVGCEIEEKIIKQLVGCLWHGCLGYQLLHRVHRNGVHNEAV